MAPFPARTRTNSYPPAAAYREEESASSAKRRPVPLNSSDPVQLYGIVGTPAAGLLPLPGRSAQSTRIVVELLQRNHTGNHTFTNDKGFHNHLAHSLLASHSLGASPQLIKATYELNSFEQLPLPPLQPISITPSNWTEYLGDARLYPNFLAFFHKLIATPPASSSPYAGRKSSVVPVLEKYLLGGEGEMLVRALSGAIHPLIHIGHGVEFKLDAIVAEGLAQCAVHDAAVAPLFPFAWPPLPPRPSSFTTSFSSVLSSLKLTSPNSTLFGSPPIALPSDSFTETAATLSRIRRAPKEGLSGFSILERISNDPNLAPGAAGSLEMDGSRLGETLRLRGERIVMWCEEWKFSVEKSGEYEDEGKGKNGTMKTPGWEEIVEKCEELIWMTTVIYAASSRPGYRNTKLDFFLMHGLTSALFLPSILEVVSPHLRPYILHSHFRVMVAYWVSRGRPQLYIRETLMSATDSPLPPSTPSGPSAISLALAKQTNLAASDSSTEEEAVEDPQTPTTGIDGKLKVIAVEESARGDEEGEAQDSGINAWMGLLASAVDHPDQHVVKVIRALAFAANHFGHSEKGIYRSSLPGTESMDGSIFIRAAGLTMKGMGWAHEGQPAASWSRTVLGFDSTWFSEPKVPNYVPPPLPSLSSTPSWKGRSTTTTPARSPPLGSTTPLKNGGTVEILLNSGSGAVLDDRTYHTSVFMGESDAEREERERKARNAAEEEERELMA